MILIYKTVRYGNMATAAIRDAYIKEYDYMVGCNMALMLPQNHINSKGISLGLLPPYPENGNIITEVK